MSPAYSLLFYQIELDTQKNYYCISRKRAIYFARSEQTADEEIVKNFEELFSIFSKKLKEDYESHFYYARSLRNVGKKNTEQLKLEKSIDLFNFALNLTRDPTAVYYEKGVALFELAKQLKDKDKNKACILFQEAEQLFKKNKNNFDNIHFLIATLILLEKLQKALIRCHSALELFDGFLDKKEKLLKQKQHIEKAIVTLSPNSYKKIQNAISTTGQHNSSSVKTSKNVVSPAFNQDIHPEIQDKFTKKHIEASNTTNNNKTIMLDRNDVRSKPILQFTNSPVMVRNKQDNYGNMTYSFSPELNPEELDYLGDRWEKSDLIKSRLTGIKLRLKREHITYRFCKFYDEKKTIEAIGSWGETKVFLDLVQRYTKKMMYSCIEYVIQAFSKEVEFYNGSYKGSGLQFSGRDKLNGYDLFYINFANRDEFKKFKLEYQDNQLKKDMNSSKNLS